MYSLSFTSLRLIRRCPISHAWSISNVSRITYSDSDYRKLTTTGRNFKTDIGNDKNFSTASKVKNLSSILEQTKDLFTTIQVKDSAKAPVPVFWYSMVGIVPTVLPTFSFLIFGFSPSLATFQLTFSATICSFLGGMKCGFAICEGSGHEPSWENIGWGIIPQVIAWLGLLIPPTLGFILISAGLAASAFIDLTTVNYPPWFKALRLALSVPVILCLFLSAILRLLH